jgi:3-hydroxyacyl-CoA dehydrogenase
VIWSPDDVFSAGANLEALMPVFMTKGSKGIAPEEKKLQDAMLRIRYANVPVVAALRGIALGGGCELAVHSAKRVAAMESYVGLVEVGVGLIPGGGGLAYIARRAAENAQAAPGSDLLGFIKEGFTAAAMAKVGTSAIESRKLGYLLDSDVIVPNKDELLYVAVNEAKAMAESGYRPPLKKPFPAAGRSAIATIKAQLVGMRDGGFISQHDFHISSLIADVVCGGEVEAGSLVTEEFLMALERKHFCGMLDHPKTQERIMGMLQTGKPVRN